MLKAKASNEIEWINNIDNHTIGNFALIDWTANDVKGDMLMSL